MADLAARPWEAIVPLLLVLAVAAVAVGLARAGRGLGGDFEIRRRRDGRVILRGRIPAARSGALREFFGRDLGADGPVVVRGSYDGPGGAPRLRLSGRLTPVQRQRVRNFLLEHLR